MALLIVAAASCSDASKGSALPAADASPKSVALAYIAAINDHDIPTARSLLSPEHAALVDSEPDSWFRNVIHISDVTIHASTEGGGPAMNGYEETARVGFGCNLQQKQVMSMPNGPITWGFQFGRHPGERWVIIREGVG